MKKSFITSGPDSDIVTCHSKALWGREGMGYS